MIEETAAIAVNGVAVKPREVAEEAGLRYMTDTSPGWRRKRMGKGFVYLDKAGSRIANPVIINRIKKLAIPPAWRDVWICPDPDGHIQATGTDAKGRKQYIYHPKWHEVSNTTKFNRMVIFADSLPYIRMRVDDDMKQRSMTKDKVAALVVTLLEKTLIRIGNVEYTIQNDSYGLTTLRNDHINVNGSTISFFFKGKSGRLWKLDINDRRLARLVRQCQDLPGQELFQYVDDDGEIQTITSQDINQYLKSITEYDFTAKDFRTWGGTVRLARELYKTGPAGSEKEFKTNVNKAVSQAAKILCNTTTVCRKYYIHPDVIESYRDGSLFQAIDEARKNTKASDFGLDAEEAAVINILRSKSL